MNWLLKSAQSMDKWLSSAYLSFWLVPAVSINHFFSFALPLHKRFFFDPPLLTSLFVGLIHFFQQEKESSDSHVSYGMKQSSMEISRIYPNLQTYSVPLAGEKPELATEDCNLKLQLASLLPIEKSASSCGVLQPGVKASSEVCTID